MTWLQFQAVYTSQLTLITSLKLTGIHADAHRNGFGAGKQLFQNIPMLCYSRHTDHMVGLKKDYVREFEGFKRDWSGNCTYTQQRCISQQTDSDGDFLTGILRRIRTKTHACRRAAAVHAPLSWELVLVSLHWGGWVISLCLRLTSVPPRTRESTKDGHLYNPCRTVK